MYKIAICDDDRNYVEKLKQKLRSLCVETVFFYEYYSGEAFLANVHLQHELIFMDIQLGGMNGIKVAKQLRTTNKNGILVFCSGVQSPTPDSFKTSPFRYLIKQYSDARLNCELGEILVQMKMVFGEHYIMVGGKQSFARVCIRDILYISKLKRGSLLHLIPSEAGKYGEEMRSPDHLRDLHTKLAVYGFEYAHDSYIVNCGWVEQFNKYVAVLNGGECLSISRSKSEEFKRRMMEVWGQKYENV